MKSRKLIPLYFVLLLVFPLLLDGCKKIEEGLSAITWQINFDLITTTWDIQFIDAATGLPIGANSEDRLAVTVSGDDQRHILDLAGIRQPTFYSSKGTLALAMHPDHLAPQTQAPVSFVMHVSHPLYLPVNIPILTYHAGINPVKVYLVSRSQAPVNVDMLTQTGVAQTAGSGLSDSLKLYTRANMASIKAQAGTQALYANGVQLTGNLNFTFSYWEGSTVNGLKTFPGGQLSVNSTGNPGLIYLASGIYVDIRDNDGNFATSLSKPIECTAIVNRAVYDPSTRKKITAGQAIPIWLMNPDSGVWESKGTTILEAFQNVLLVNFNLESPGQYMVGWINQNLCTSPVLLRPNTLPEYNEIPYAFTINIFEVFENEFRYVRSSEISGQVTEDNEMRFLPDNAELVVRFEPYTTEDRPYYRNPDPLLLAGFCESGSPVEFDLLPKPNSNYKKIEVVFIDINHNNTRYNPKVFPGYYRKTGTVTWQSAFVYDGGAYIVNAQQGDLYEMGINYKGKFHLKEVTIGPEDIVLVEIKID